MNNLLKTLFISLTLVACSQSNQSEIKKNNPPNIIYILADDLGYGDIGILGQKKFETPNLDRLAKGGMIFTQHYSGSTVCAPSRSALMTGQHTGHTFIRGNSEMGYTLENEGQYPLLDKEITIAEVLKGAGYETGAFGKWGLGFPGSEGDPINQGFNEFYGYNCQRVAHNYYPTHLWSNFEKISLEQNLGGKKETYAPFLIHEKALQFIEKNKTNPFFMFYPSLIPHAELVVPDKYLEKYRNDFLPEKKYIKKNSPNKYTVGGYNSQDESHAAFVAMVSILDQQVGEIIDKVNELGIAENTIIIFSSDNGPHLEGGADPDYFNSNGKFKGYKRDLYEGGIRVPTFVYWPETINGGQYSKHISAFWDFFPTAMEIAGIKNDYKHLDGISFLPELKGENQKKHKYLYWEFQERGGKQAVRLNEWKGLKINMSIDPNSQIELYNLSDDIGEKNNVAKNFPNIVNKMREIMDNEHLESEIFKFEFEKKK